MNKPPRRLVVQRKNDPFVYLYVMGEWYCYNPYDPREKLGEGAMGIVYRGYRCSNGDVIAVKRVLPKYENNKMVRDRARLEASLAFRHPNLVEMIGCCEDNPNGGPIFLLSHFVQGDTIDKYIQGFSDSETRVTKVCNAICSVLDALDYVHSRGVIHRDIKPSNIMIENGSNVRLMDLGISRMNGGNSFSMDGFIGTPQYSAPEQIKRNEGNAANPINATTDIYELGITFYELLTGENPMDCESDAETLSKQLTSPLPSNDRIPKKLMHVIWKATEKEQAKRFQTAHEFKSAINEALQPTPTLWDTMSLWIQDHLVVFMVALAIIASAILFTILLI